MRIQYSYVSLAAILSLLALNACAERTLSNVLLFLIATFLGAVIFQEVTESEDKSQHDD